MVVAYCTILIPQMINQNQQKYKPNLPNFLAGVFELYMIWKYDFFIDHMIHFFGLKRFYTKTIFAPLLIFCRQNKQL